MANTVAQLVVDLKAETAQFRSDMSKATKAMTTNTAKMRRSVGALSKSMKGLRAAVGFITKAFLALTAIMGAGAVLRIADDYNVLQERIKSATRATNDYKEVSKGLSDIAKQTGADLKDSVDVFQRLSLGAKDLGKSNKDVLSLVKSVQQLGVISGASGTAMSAGLLQFGQAMSAGVVRAEEFNSIVENLPMLAQKIADGFGVSVGQLRQMVLDGGVLSKDVFEILVSQSKDIEKEFEQMPVSLGRAVNGLKLTMTEYLGIIDRSTGASSVLANVIQSLTEFFTKHKDTIEQVFTAMVNLWKSVGQLLLSFANLAKNLFVLRPLFEKLFSKLGEGSGTLQNVIKFVNWLADAFTKLANKINQAASAIGRFWDKQIGKVMQGFGQVKGLFQNIANFNDNSYQFSIGFDANTNYTDIVNGIKQGNKNVQSSTQSMTNEIEQAVNSLSFGFQSAFQQMAQTGKFEIRGMVNSILSDLARIASRGATGLLTKGISSLMGNLFGGGGGASVTPVLPTSDLTFAANGADARSNQPFIVGEEGPELFMPRSAGSIIPHSQSMAMMGGGSGSVVVNQTFNISTGVQQTVRAEIAQMMPQIEKQTTGAVTKAISRGGTMAKAVGVRS